MVTYSIIFLITGIIQLVVLIILIIKFFQLTTDVNSLKNSLTSSSIDFCRNFYKWYTCGNIDKAKEVLTNEISNSPEFQQLIRGGNEKHMEKVKEELKKKYQTELSLTGIILNFENWI